jgi:hypothetical protein
MARSKRSSMQNSSKIWKMWQKAGKLWSHTSNYMVHYKIFHKMWLTKGIICNSCTLRPHASSYWQSQHNRRPPSKSWRPQVEALQATANEGNPVNFKPGDALNEVQFLEFGKVYGFDGIPNSPAPSKKTFCAHTFIQSITAFSLDTSWHHK